MAQKFYSPDEVATILGVSRSYVYQQIQRNNITYRKFGHMVRISDDDLDEFVNREVYHPSMAGEANV